jgi:hypothetical protein
MQEMTGGRTVPRVFVVQMLKSQILNRPLKFIPDMIYKPQGCDFFSFFFRVGVRQGGKFIGGGDDTAILSYS